MSNGIIKFYCRYVDDTLLLIKHDDIKFLLSTFHSFDRNIRPTYDIFSNKPPHFLDLKLDGNKFSIYRKRTFTGQYTHFDSYLPWKHRIACIRSLLCGITNICSPSKLSQEMQFIKKIASSNVFPKHVISSLKKRFTNQKEQIKDKDNNTTETNDTRPTLWLEMPYIGTEGQQLLRSLEKKLSRCLNTSKVQIKTKVSTTKLNFITNAKDKVPKQNKSSIVYEFTCPKCNSCYIGKTNRTLLERMKEHAYKDKESAIHKHLDSCYDKAFLTSQSNTQLTDLVLG